LNGEDLRDLPIEDRKARLEALLASAPELLRYSADIDAPPEQLLREVKARGLEGIIGKRRGSLYEIGRRSGTWIKLKCVNDRSLSSAGTLHRWALANIFERCSSATSRTGELKFAGRLAPASLRKLLAALFEQFQPLRRATCPFANLPEKAGGRWTQNITPAEMRRCTWVEPTTRVSAEILPSGLAMISCGTPCFSELGTTRTPARWFERPPA
jgi:bifunctional non-homologous end joining protein LigD